MTLKKLLILVVIITLSVGGMIDRSKACTNLLITKGASKDGSCMVTYAADSHTRYGFLLHLPAAHYPKGSMMKIYEYGTNRYLGEIPQAEETYNVIGNMNEHQLLLGESTWGGIESLYDPNGGLDYGSLMYIALQRCKTAREAIKLMTDLANEYGYASTGESISVADKDEVWILEIIGKSPKIVNGVNVNKGAVWVAIRIPDGAISAHANQARITSFPKNDKDNCLYSPDVISYARESGLFSGKDSEFSFADVYGPADAGTIRGCDARVWSFFNRFAKEDMGKYLNYALGKEINNRMPLFVYPKEKLSLKQVADMMRDHYEGTEMDMTQDIGAGGNELPYRWRPMGFKENDREYINERAIATQQTGFWFVGQCRSKLPDEIGGLFWFAVDDAGTSPLTPVYASSTNISKHYQLGEGNMIKYSPESMFWLCNRIAQFAYLRYNHIGKEVRENVDIWENDKIAEIQIMDEMGCKLLKQNRSMAVKFLTDYSVNTANSLFDRWQELDQYLLVKYIDGNTKKQNPDGSFKTNGHCNTVPPTPDFPGYSKKWKEAVAKDLDNK